MMERLAQWPAVLRRRWLVQAAAGLECLISGAIMFLTAGDRVLLTISILLALFTAARCFSLYRLIAGGEYQTAEGVCIHIKNAPLRRQRSISLLMESGEERTILLDKQIRVRIGNCYRVYFRQIPAPRPSITQDLFLTLENLGKYQTENG